MLQLNLIKMNRLFLLLFGVFTLVAHAQVPDYVPTDGLVAWYPFNGNANDESGYGHHGTLNFDANLASDRNGTSESAIYLDGHQDYFSTPPIFNSAGEHSVVMWFELTDPNALTQTLYNTNPHNIESMAWNTYFLTEPGFSYCLNSVADQWSIVCGPNGAYSVDHDMSGWVQWAVSKNDLQWRFFLNGELIFETETMQNTVDSLVPLWFGAISGGNNPPNEEMRGTIDEIGIWDRALTENEILTLFLGTEAVFGCLDPTACNFNEEANEDDGSCVYPPSESVDCEFGGNYCGVGTVWDANLQVCVGFDDCPADLNGNGLVEVSDLLMVLADFGTECPPEVAEWTCGDPVSYQGYDYATVLIGEQCWFAENLRNESYENGDAIPAGLSFSEWSSTTSGATAVHGEIASNLETYGRQYNWYAVVDSRGLCPSGWHVPTDGEWTVMTDFLGGENVAGGQMKTTYGWYQGGNGTNSSGFSGLPGGFGFNDGNFYAAGGSGYWWSSSPDGSFAWNRSLNSIYGDVNRFSFSRRCGFSVRCVRDAE